VSKLKYDPIKTKRTQKNPRALANLKPAKKGEVRNPEGSRSHNPIIKAFNKLHQEHFRSALSEALLSDPEELDKLAARVPGNPSIKRLIARALRNAIRNGEYGLLDRMADRLFGKVADVLNVNEQPKKVSVDKAELAKAVDELENDV